MTSRRSLPGMLHTWARAGSHRFPGEPSYAFALLQDPGRAGKISPWRSCRYCPRATQAEGLNGYIISRLTQGFSIRCLRFTNGVAAAHARLASGWRAAPLPGGGRTLWIASKGFRLHPILLSRTSPVARVVYAKPPFGGPEAVLAYLSRYTHRVAISNRRLISLDENGVTFRYKDYRRDSAERYRTMTLTTDEFIRRFLLHVLPKGFHRIRHYGLLASATRKANVARVRQLLAVPPAAEPDEPVELTEPLPPCPCCGGRMIITETFQRWMQPRGPPASPASTGMMTP